MPGREFAGQLVVENDDMVAWAPNITPDRRTGIGEWTDEEIVIAIREGVRPDGSIIGPPMPIPSYRKMSDRDVEALVAYLRSTPPVVNVTPASQFIIPLPAGYGPPVGNVEAPIPENTARYREYLVAIGHCLECHTPLGADGHFDFRNQLGAGGLPLRGSWGTSVSPNLTSSKDGLAEFSDEDITKMITTGTRADGSRMMPPMGYSYYAHISSDDLSAIVKYLRTLPPKSNPE